MLQSHDLVAGLGDPNASISIVSFQELGLERPRDPILGEIIDVTEKFSPPVYVVDPLGEAALDAIEDAGTVDRHRDVFGALRYTLPDATPTSLTMMHVRKLGPARGITMLRAPVADYRALAFHEAVHIGQIRWDLLKLVESFLSLRKMFGTTWQKAWEKIVQRQTELGYALVYSAAVTVDLWRSLGQRDRMTEAFSHRFNPFEWRLFNQWTTVLTEVDAWVRTGHYLTGTGETVLPTAVTIKGAFEHVRTTYVKDAGTRELLRHLDPMEFWKSCVEPMYQHLLPMPEPWRVDTAALRRQVNALVGR
jgi:hypothetical protein